MRPWQRHHASEKPGEHAGRSKVWSRDEVRRLDIRCGLGDGSICHTEATVRLRSVIKVGAKARRTATDCAAHLMSGQQEAVTGAWGERW